MADTVSTDHEQIRDLMARNTAWLDGHGGEVADVFAPEITLHSPRGETRGHADVAARIGPDPDRPVQFQHFFTDLLIELDGDHASIRANLLVHAFRPGSAPHNVRGVRAEYGASRRQGRWLFTDAGIHQLWESGEPLA